jgi:Tfp pilus assembly protein PilX
MTRPRPRLAIPARGEDGYAVVVTVTIALVLTMLLVVVLSQALHNNTATTVEARRSRALG